MNPFPTRTLQAGGILGLLTMAAIGWKLADGPESQSASPPEMLKRSRDRSGSPDSVRRRLAALRAIHSPNDSLRATMALANSLPVSEIQAWLDGRWFPSVDGFDRTLFTKLLEERWALEDPGGMLAWSVKNGRDSSQADALLDSWVKTDPRRALDFFKNHPDLSLEVRTLKEMAKRDPSLVLQALAEKPAVDATFISGDPSGSYVPVFQELARCAPDALESALASLPPALRKQAEAALIGSRLATSFDTEIRKLWARPEGWSIFGGLRNDNGDLGDRILAELANLPPAWPGFLH